MYENDQRIQRIEMTTLSNESSNVQAHTEIGLIKSKLEDFEDDLIAARRSAKNE
jgi:hypothetical protein